MTEEEERTSHEKTVTIKITKTRLWQLLTLIFAVLFVISIFTDGFSFGDDKDKITGSAQAVAPQPTQRPTEPAQAPQPSAPALITDVSEDDDATKGNADAPVTIIEFSDYQCPYCGRFYQNTLPNIIQDYIDTDKVKLVYRDFPLSFHENAQKAAEAAECAGEQDMYWDMHNILFENQNDLSISALKNYAKEIGLDTKAFNSCLDNGDMRLEVQSDFRDGSAAGVSGTPAFFINGKKIVGAQPYSIFKAEIDAALAK